MNKPTEMPLCKYEHGDCAAYRNGRCRALNSTEFKKNRCPFYKSREQNEAECKAVEKRLRNKNLEYIQNFYREETENENRI